MRAIYYLHIDNLKYSDKESKEDYISKLISFLDDLTFIARDKIEENSLVFHRDVLEKNLFEDQTIFELIKREDISKDQEKTLLMAINQVSDWIDFDYDELRNMSQYDPNETECRVAVVINKPSEGVDFSQYMQFDTYELVYDKNSWRTVRRQILGNHPENAESFMKRAKVYFPDLEFSDNCERVVGEYLETVPRKMVYYLSCMNDHLWSFWNSHPHQDSSDIYCADFAGKFGMDRAGSPQSTPQKKDKYTFEFIIGGEPTNLCCSPHFKGTHVDDNCNVPGIQPNEVYHSRIYFAINEDGIYVGSIGPHIK